MNKSISNCLNPTCIVRTIPSDVKQQVHLTVAVGIKPERRSTKLQRVSGRPLESIHAVLNRPAKREAGQHARQNQERGACFYVDDFFIGKYPN
jgi:hypothetical protein